ncbi:hypothetical protein DFH09DRAFT_1270719 [Mycena vulgaris]|nr:hypothetical protein DFH09DRAFT_1270719 [Mycena vulgaris]
MKWGPWPPETDAPHQQNRNSLARMAPSGSIWRIWPTCSRIDEDAQRHERARPGILDSSGIEPALCYSQINQRLPGKCAQYNLTAEVAGSSRLKFSKTSNLKASSPKLSFWLLVWFLSPCNVFGLQDLKPQANPSRSRASRPAISPFKMAIFKTCHFKTPYQDLGPSRPQALHVLASVLASLNICPRARRVGHTSMRSRERRLGGEGRRRERERDGELIITWSKNRAVLLCSSGTVAGG